MCGKRKWEHFMNKVFVVPVDVRLNKDGLVMLLITKQTSKENTQFKSDHIYHINHCKTSEMFNKVLLWKFF